MRTLHRRVRAGGAAVLGLTTVALLGAFASAHAATAAPSGVTARFTALTNSLPVSTGRAVGAFTTSSMSVEVALASRNEAGLAAELRAVYTPGSGHYHQWLAKGQFDARYAPAAAERDGVATYLRNQGLTVRATDSPFLIRVTGPSAKITAAFHTALSYYTGQRGIRYFANSRAVSLPASIAGGVQGVIGLTDTVRLHSMIVRPRTQAPSASAAPGPAAGCESSYVTAEELFAAVNTGTTFPYGYGDGPDCSGLTPAQTNSLYGAPTPSPGTEGAGVAVAVAEFSAYKASDIDTWARYFYGPGYTPDLTNVTIDGGPLAPVCPKGDSCPASINGYSGDIEVDADIEQEMAVARDAHVYVYNAPNDETGQTSLDEYSAIASQDIASTVSSSWGECEDDVSASYVQAENTIFEQMALQGQSMFNSAGDTGAFECIQSGSNIVNQSDPASQPWVTSVGGTSFESDNPGTNPSPAYPADGTETVWNVDNLCNEQAAAPGNDELGGYEWCALTGAGGGGYSQYWGRPFYQAGPGVNNPDTAFGNGSTNCSLAAVGTPCREVPDVSANADEYTPYAEYCTGSASTPYSTCATVNAAGGGWFGIGGTSLSSPLWGALIADRDGYQGHRTGNINPLVYTWLRTDPGKYFHDITGIGPLQQVATTNGLYPATPGYDEATGAGTPVFAAIITS